MKNISIFMFAMIMLMTACAQPIQQDSQGSHVKNPKHEDVQLASINYDEVVEQTDEDLVKRNQAFAFDMFRTLLEDNNADNVFISPLSISLALAMTYNGAGGETKEQMAQALQWQGMDSDTVNEGLQLLQQLMVSADPEVKLSIANSLWAREGLAFNEDFLRVNESFYDAEVTALDFNDSQSAQTINRWVDKQTMGMIDQIIKGPIPEDTILYLINAIYFKGAWSKPFKEDMTYEQTFHLADGTVIQHPLMSQSGTYAYLENDQFQAVRLPYGDEKRTSMVVFLPLEHSNLQQFYTSLTSDNWNKWRSEFKETEGSIRLPRFQIEYEQTLNDAFQSLGMIDAFDEMKADFTPMITGPFNVLINTIKHQSVIEVNEVGTEAAAVTVVEMVATSMPVDYFNMTVDRPFFFAIIDEATDTILFMGSVERPTD